MGQIGNGGVDHGFWGRPEEMTMNRFLLLFMMIIKRRKVVVATIDDNDNAQHFAFLNGL